MNPERNNTDNTVLGPHFIDCRDYPEIQKLTPLPGALSFRVLTLGVVCKHHLDVIPWIPSPYIPPSRHFLVLFSKVGLNRFPYGVIPALCMGNTAPRRLWSLAPGLPSCFHLCLLTFWQLGCPYRWIFQQPILSFTSLDSTVANTFLSWITVPILVLISNPAAFKTIYQHNPPVHSGPPTTATDWSIHTFF